MTLSTSLYPVIITGCRVPEVFGYVLICNGGGSSLSLDGTITSRALGSGQCQRVKGDEKIMLRPFHWADKNMDNKIDDQEILAVYDEYSKVKGLRVDMDLIEEMWFGSGYRWDKKMGSLLFCREKITSSELKCCRILYFNAGK